MKGIAATVTVFSLCGLLSCSPKSDYSGIYEKRSGTCAHKFVQLRKVRGFGERYYLIYTLKEGETWRNGEEFLGVVKGNVISVNSHTITVHGGAIHIRAKTKSCVYVKYVPRTQGS